MNTRNIYKVVCCFIAIQIFFACDSNLQAQNNEHKTKLPNIIYILADDLGYSEIGAYGQGKIETPNLDLLAKNGIKFTQHYSGSPVCAPARYNLLTGKHSGHSYIRGNDEWAERGNVWDYKSVVKDSTLEGQRPLPEGTILFPMLLKKEGYRTGIVGKWGLGAPNTESIPTKMGFDFFYGYNDQRQSHTYYPVHLYKNESKVHLDNDTIPPTLKLDKGADPYDPKSYEKFSSRVYSPDLMFGAVSDFVSANKDKPFFLYWATPLPHVSLQAPQKWVDYYVKKFGDEAPYTGNKDYLPTRYPHATYAAMISYLDENIGKLVAQLKEEGVYENTLIVFTSDNGPTFNGGTDSPWFSSANPFRSEEGYGKGYLYEGGIRIPMIAAWPGHIKPGSESAHISAHYDVMATLADITGFEKPEKTDGISFLPTLLGQKNKQKEHEFLFWEYPEYGGQVAIRMGDWKVLRRNLKNKQTPTLELYNLKNDPTESTNLLKSHPEIIKRAAEIFKREHENASSERFGIPLIEKGLLGNEKK